mgnify:FL=1
MKFTRERGRSTTRRMRDALHGIKRTGNTLTVWDRMVPFDEFWEICGLAEVKALEKKYGV